MVAAWQNASLPFDAAVGVTGALAIFGGIGIILWARFTHADKEITVTGDSFNNFGNNFGHMGPINNFGKQDFQLTPQNIDQAIRACPKNNPVLIQAVGTQSAIQMGRELENSMKNAGFQVSLTSILSLLPAPEHPFEIETSKTHSIVTIAPKA